MKKEQNYFQNESEIHIFSLSSLKSNERWNPFRINRPDANFGTILFVQQNSWQFWKVEAFWICFICTQNSIHFLMLEEFWIYFICTNQYWGPIFQTINLFYLYWHFQSQLIILGILWEYILLFIFFYILFFYILFFLYFIFYILCFYIHLVEINMELMFLSRFWGNFVSMEGRRKEGKF